ncbi:MAG TPA: hypothetical protein VEH50_06180 [Methylomirabilota bacterium]|nr:hypothetical protein [Methylomirabilota bacterium]
MKRFLIVLAMAVSGTVAYPQSNSSKKATIIQPSHDVVIPATLQKKLAAAADIEAFQSLPNQDDVVVYDTIHYNPNTIDFLDNHPHVAIFRNGDIVLDLDSVTLAPFGPVGFHGMAISPVSHGPVVAAFAFTLAVDQSGTFFVFVGEKSGKYKVIATLSGSQAQVRFTDSLSRRFEFWTAGGPFDSDPDEQCVWCRKFYKKTTYAWQNGQLRQLLTSKEKQAYDPWSFQDTPFMPIK